jgi:hypothetical protein
MRGRTRAPRTKTGEAQGRAALHRAVGATVVALRRISVIAHIYAGSRDCGREPNAGVRCSYGASARTWVRVRTDTRRARAVVSTRRVRMVESCAGDLARADGTRRS